MSLGPYHDELYEQVLPLHGPDPDGLARDYVGACAHGVIEVDDLVRDTDAGPGWGVILDVDDAPAKGLPWLAQVAGVALRPPKFILERTNLVTTPVPTVGTQGAGSFQASVASQQSGLELYGPYHLHFIRGSAAQALLNYETYPVGDYVGDWFARAVVPGREYTWAIDVLATSAPVRAAIRWYDAADTFISESTETAGTSLTRRVINAVSPANAVGALVVVWLTGTTIGDTVDLEGPMFEEGTTDGSFFVGTDSLKRQFRRSETEDEFATYARSAIRNQGAKFRGTRRAMLDAVRDTLTGTRYVNILERVGGNAYALTLVTRPSETPDSALTYAAALAQKPLGMALTHTLTESPLIDEGSKTIDTGTATIDTATISDVAN